MILLKKNLYHNAVGGKCNRGMSVVDTVSILLSRKLSKEEYFRAASLGWMVELLQAFFLVSDDIMDGSQTRRGNPCWYLMPTVGMSAINDAFLLESAIYLLLKKYFRQEKYYVDLLELFHEITLQTELGQSCDLLTAPEDNVNLNRFSMEKFSFIVIFKTAYYSFYLPVALALYFCNTASGSQRTRNSFGFRLSYMCLERGPSRAPRHHKSVWGGKRVDDILVAHQGSLRF